MRRFNRRNIIYPLGQVVLIFIGVTVATWFENLNEKRKDIEFEKVLLNEMTLNLASDTVWIATEVRVISKAINSGKKILDVLAGTREEEDSVRFYMVDLMWYSTTAYNNSSYETIKSRGLDLIQNNDLRQKITNYYDVRVEDNSQVSKIGYNVAWNHYAPMVITRFKDFSIKNGTPPVNLEKLKNDQEFQQFIHLTIEMKKIERVNYVGLRKSAVKLLKAIKAEIE